MFVVAVVFLLLLCEYMCGFCVCYLVVYMWGMICVLSFVWRVSVCCFMVMCYVHSVVAMRVCDCSLSYEACIGMVHGVCTCLLLVVYTYICTRAYMLCMCVLMCSCL